MVAEFDDSDVLAGVARLRRLYGAGAVAEARRQRARYAAETWGGQWWAALARELEARPRNGLSPRLDASIQRPGRSRWSDTEACMGGR